VEDILSDQALETIRDRYYAGVTAAELGFDFNKGDEDSLTGALGQELLTPLTEVTSGDGTKFKYAIYHYKLRGHGPNAPEKPLGADGIFQIEVTDSDGSLLRRKGLLFQAKKEWTGKDARLSGQARKMAEKPRAGIVIDFGPHGYSTCHAELVAQAEGDRHRINENQFSRLAKTLGDDFLRCRVGAEGLWYDPERELLIKPDSDEPGMHVIDTRVQRLSQRIT
jgi:hypothetical protein